MLELVCRLVVGCWLLVVVAVIGSAVDCAVDGGSDGVGARASSKVVV